MLITSNIAMERDIPTKLSAFLFIMRLFSSLMLIIIQFLSVAWMGKMYSKRRRRRKLKKTAENNYTINAVVHVMEFVLWRYKQMRWQSVEMTQFISLNAYFGLMDFFLNDFISYLQPFINVVSWFSVV